MRDPRDDILFEPVPFGPLALRNRLHQAPRCNGLGAALPYSRAAMRGVKAEGGWLRNHQANSPCSWPARQRRWTAPSIQIGA